MKDRKTITLRYVAIVLKEPDTGYCATVPDLGTCFAIGRTASEAKASLPDAVALHIEGMRAENTPMPPARHRDEILMAIGYDVAEDYVVEIDAPSNQWWCSAR